MLAPKLRAASESFSQLWDRHEVGLLRAGLKLVLHPRGRLELSCAVLPGRAPRRRLVLFRPEPGSRTDHILAAG